MFPSSNLITSPIPVFWNRINGSISIFYIYPQDSINTNSINLNSIISLPLELYNPNNSFDSSFEYLIQNNYLTSLPQKLANVWKMIGWCYNKTHIIDSTLMRNYSSILDLKNNLLDKTNKEKGYFFLNSYQELLIDSPNCDHEKHLLTLLPLELVDTVVKKLIDPNLLPDIENNFTVNQNSSNYYKFPRRPNPIIPSTPQTITFGSITPSLQSALQSLQNTLSAQPNTPTEISTTAEPSENNDQEISASPELQDPSVIVNSHT